MVTQTRILNARVLVVDDKEVNIHLLEGMLRVAGYTKVESTMDPTAVRELHRANRYDLILLDLQMPRMDGFEVMDSLKEIEHGGYLPVLVITAQPDLKLRALKAGARDFVSKPFDFAELRARVHNVIEVRLLHLEAIVYGKVLEDTIRDLEASREVIRLNTLAEQARSKQEWVLAQETQESLLPRLLPRFDGFHVDAFNAPTRYVGGDFYDFLPLPCGGWVGILADVSGKGMPAALLSSMVLGALSMEFRSGTEPIEVLNRVNRLLLEKSLPSQFVTLFLFLLNPDGQGHFINAGHDPAYLYRAATGTIEKLHSDSYILGLFECASWTSRTLQLSKGDVLLIYSDGLIDAQDQAEEAFGEKRLRDIVHRHAPRGGNALKRELLSAVEAFTQGTPQIDDITFVAVEKCQG